MPSWRPDLKSVLWSTNLMPSQASLHLQKLFMIWCRIWIDPVARCSKFRGPKQINNWIIMFAKLHSVIIFVSSDNVDSTSVLYIKQSIDLNDHTCCWLCAFWHRGVPNNFLDLNLIVDSVGICLRHAPESVRDVALLVLLFVCLFVCF